jgi:short-subunit dehydrogenase
MHVLITGASSGIGEALGREYLTRHADITVVARRRDRLESLVAGAATKTHIIEADLATACDGTGRGRDLCGSIIDEAQSALGPIDVLINNAGVMIVAPLRESSIAEGERLITINLLVPLRMTKAVLPQMMQRGRGAIVDIASMAGLMPTAFMTYYSASKGGLGAASEGLRGELRPHGIHVLTVYPGPVASDMAAFAHERLTDSRVARWAPQGNTKDLAKIIADGVERKVDRVIYPRVYGITRHLPNVSRWFTDRLMPAMKDS